MLKNRRKQNTFAKMVKYTIFMQYHERICKIQKKEKKLRKKLRGGKHASGVRIKGGGVALVGICLKISILQTGLIYITRII